MPRWEFGFPWPHLTSITHGDTMTGHSTTHPTPSMAPVDLHRASRVRDDFHFPKLHFLLHYAASIRPFGTTDNYNKISRTPYINPAKKKPSHAATNRKDKLAHMVWLRWEKRPHASKTSSDGDSVVIPVAQRESAEYLWPLHPNPRFPKSHPINDV